MKGFSNLVEAVARLRDEHGLRARLSVAGEGPEREPLSALIAAKGLGGQATLRGLLEAGPLREMLRGGDLYVLPAIGAEAFSISALEAASVGLPLLLSDRVGLGEFPDRGRLRDLPGARRRCARLALDQAPCAPVRCRLDRFRRAPRPAARPVFAGDRGASDSGPPCDLTAHAPALSLLGGMDGTARPRGAHAVDLRRARAGRRRGHAGHRRRRGRAAPAPAGDRQCGRAARAAPRRALAHAGAIRSTAIFLRNFNAWLPSASAFDLGYIIHLKSAPSSGRSASGTSTKRTRSSRRRRRTRCASASCTCSRARC
ncbi:MAG: glycosyltransferase [Verrucomicrobiota bacterium]